MELIPIFNTLRRHKTAALLIVLEIAFTCAIVCNAVFLIRERLTRMNAESGVVEDEIVEVRLTGIGQKTDAEVSTRQDVAGLRGIPGVKTVTPINMIPFGGSSWNTSISTIPKDPNSPLNAATYMGSYDMAEAYGLKIIAGRWFNREEFVTLKSASDAGHIPAILISRASAEKLFPGGDAVGKAIYAWGDDPTTVLGVYENIRRPNDWNGKAGAYYTAFLPLDLTYDDSGAYVMRVDPSQRTAVLKAADAVLQKVDPARIILERLTFPDIRKRYFRQDHTMAWLLGGVVGFLLIITALGVIGLASFWVQQRTRQIGVRRALGATRGDILRYFQTENFILATMGIILGMVLAYALNLMLMSKYEIPRLPIEYMPIGAAVLWALGQIAVLGPALRAAAIPPAIATRSI
ncbi:MAG TPA: FtsX-like permease family protein [Kofleriaceae bacterium]